MDDSEDNILNCEKCFGLVHKDCMKVWLSSAIRKGCCFCQDPGITKYVN